MREIQFPLGRRLLSMICRTLERFGPACVSASSWAGDVRGRKASVHLRVQTSVTSLQIERVDTAGDFVVVSVRNVSNKDVVAYSHALGTASDPNSRVDNVGTLADVAIARGASIAIAIPKAILSCLQIENGEATVNLVAAIFGDQTVEGDPDVTSVLRDISLAETTQLRRVHRLLERTLQAEEQDYISDLEDLEQEIAALPEAPEAGQSAYFVEGLVHAKRYALYLIGNARDNSSSDAGGALREHLYGVVKQIEQRLGKYLVEQ